MNILSSICLLFAACALFYQADIRRSALAKVRKSQIWRIAMKAAATVLCAITLFMIANLRGWELGIPIWLAMFSFVFVSSLFLAAQTPDWHPKVAGGAIGLGTLMGLGALLS